jgi:putative PIN family toxin of toxin-antitoxin system
VLRAVLDTNVYVAGVLSSKGAPARLLDALADGAFDAVVCPLLVAELRGVLGRPRIAGRLEPDVAEGFVAWLELFSSAAPDPDPIEPVSPDPTDDYLVALAREARASFIVTGDAHLLGIGLREPAAVTPATFATLLEAVDAPR